MHVYIAKFCNARLHFRGMGVANFRGLPIDLELELFFESYMDFKTDPFWRNGVSYEYFFKSCSIVVLW